MMSLLSGLDLLKHEVVHELAFISREVGGWAGIKNGGWDRAVMVKTIIICVWLSVWGQQH